MKGRWLLGHVLRCKMKYIKHKSSDNKKTNTDSNAIYQGFVLNSDIMGFILFCARELPVTRMFLHLNTVFLKM